MIDLTFLYNKASEVKSVSKSYWDITKLNIRILPHPQMEGIQHTMIYFN